MRVGLMLFAAALLGCGDLNPEAKATPVEVNAQVAAQELVLADQSFSKWGTDKTLIDSISAMMDDQAIMPLPNGSFAKGKTEIVTALRANPLNASSKVQWAPVQAGISADGTHGFTYGFMAVQDAGKPERRAKYLAYWIKRPSGWRVAAYKRAVSGAGEVQASLKPPIAPAQMVKATDDPKAIASLRASLTAAEKAFSDRAQQVGLGAAFKEFGSPNAMNMGQGPDFTFGNEAIGGGMPPDPKSPLHWAADEAVLVAPSGDLGVTFGYIRPNAAPPPGQPAAIPFFTVWHRASPNAPWRYIAE